jgi:hypothetical protein
MERDAHLHSFFTYPSGSPLKEPPLQVPLTELLQRDAQFPEHSKYLSKFPVNGPLSQVPQWRERPDSRAFFYTSPHNSPYLQSPGKVAPLHVHPTGSLWREMLCLQSQWFIHSFISVGVPVKLSHEMGEKHTITIHGGPHGWKAYI